MRIRLFCVLALLAGAPAWPAAAVPGPDLVLVTLDTTRADHLGAWGWPYARTPNLDRLAARGTRFESCDTAAPVTLVSHASIFTGLFPPRHGVRDNGTFTLDAGVETLAERLRAAGYDTAAVVSAVVLAKRHGLDQGFRVYEDDLGAGYAGATQVDERRAEATTETALKVVAGLRHPYFLWVHYYDPHEEYRPPTRFASLDGPSRLYDGEIAYVDEQLGRLLTAVGDRAVVTVVGDHGEMLGEHGEATHGLLLYAAARRVPLLLAGPGVPAGRVGRSLTRTVDVMPTLLSLAGQSLPSGLDGVALLPAAQPAATAVRKSYSESFLPFFSYRWYPLRAMSDGDWLFLQAPKPALFDLASPDGEARDQAAEQGERLAGWRGELARLLAAAGETVEPKIAAQSQLSAEQLAQLASLGYLGGGGGGQVSGDLPDPRAMADLAQRLHELHPMVQEGKCQEVLRELSAMVKRDAHNFVALNLAGFCLHQLGRAADALPLFTRAAAENPQSAVPVANMAGALKDLGRTDEAMREFRHALALDPAQADSAANLGRLLRERGQRKEAIAVLDAAWQAGAFKPEVVLERGLAKAELGDVTGALADFRDAARRDPTNPVPLENAARAAFALGQARAAAQLYEQLLRLDPRRGDIWKTVGAIYMQVLDDRAAALAAFRRALTLEVDSAERQQLEAAIRELSASP
jgi:arylsulfatase A-like enzyme/Tfp pilus assembly protein PilF